MACCHIGFTSDDLFSEPESLADMVSLVRAETRAVAEALTRTGDGSGRSAPGLSLAAQIGASIAISLLGPNGALKFAQALNAMSASEDQSVPSESSDEPSETVSAEKQTKIDSRKQSGSQSSGYRGDSTGGGDAGSGAGDSDQGDSSGSSDNAHILTNAIMLHPHSIRAFPKTSEESSESREQQAKGNEPAKSRIYTDRKGAINLDSGGKPVGSDDVPKISKGDTENLDPLHATTDLSLKKIKIDNKVKDVISFSLHVTDRRIQLDTVNKLKKILPEDTPAADIVKLAEKLQKNQGSTRTQTRKLVVHKGKNTLKRQNPEIDYGEVLECVEKVNKILEDKARHESDVGDAGARIDKLLVESTNLPDEERLQWLDQTRRCKK